MIQTLAFCNAGCFLEYEYFESLCVAFLYTFTYMEYGNVDFRLAYLEYDILISHLFFVKLNSETQRGKTKQGGELFVLRG